MTGPNKLPSSSGARYLLTIVDDYSRAVWVYLLQVKYDVSIVFRLFLAMISRQFDKNVKLVRSDNGTEFKPLLPYFDECGIVFQISCDGTPQQNSLVERKHRHILNIARALMYQGDLPLRDLRVINLLLEVGDVYLLGMIWIRGAFFVSRDIRFHENEYPFAATTSISKVSNSGSSLQHIVEELANSSHNNNDDDLSNDYDDLDHGHCPLTMTL
ncbi:hypothetical protein LIER_23161 [Lithospermum erythrorhizon]|uniref:Integrase catalytic domain-containing protein n=1 Tax=Lithospermum erythrorhizon TaxID=34254 RepID=A0AAV3R224_LITER